jgi:hypothetical protein
VVAGSVKVGPNPLVNSAGGTLNATVSDLLAGGSVVDAAEWSTGATPLPAGAGHAMTGSFAASQVAVSAALPSGLLNPGHDKGAGIIA